jgi:hypothetical protein
VSNRLKEMGETASWRLMVSAAVQGARQQGYDLKRQPGRGLSNTYEVTKAGETKVASVRTTRDRWIAFPPMDDGKQWKTLDDVDLVLVSAVDDHQNPQNVDVYIFPADEVRKRFNASYAARIANGHTVRNDYGMWVKLDAGDPDVPSQVGAGLADDYPKIARFTIDELEAAVEPATRQLVDAVPAAPDEVGGDPAANLNTVADVLTFARHKIAELTGMPRETIKLELKMGV